MTKWNNPPLNLKAKWPLFKHRTKLSASFYSSAGLLGQTTVPLALLVLLLAGLNTAGPPQLARPPLLSGQPFIIFWGIPDSSCSMRPEPGSFGMEREGRVAVFYEDTLGSYPYFIDKDTRVNGGLPQHTRLDSHLQKIQMDLDAALPMPRYLGLGVVHWAEWLPQWLRNREKKAVYQEASRTLLKAFFPNWTPEEVEKWSRGGTSGGRLYLSSQIQEALRVSSLAGVSFDLPVFPLISSVYASTNTFLSQADLLSSIGESAAMGTAGVVIWQRSETKTERECQDLAEFIRKVLGPYSINVTTATRLCSASLCEGKGRCVRQNPDSSAYLHLPPPPDVMEKVTEKEAEAAKATEEPDPDAKAAEPDPAEMWKKDFQCQWYKTTDRDVSDQQSPKDGASVDGTLEQISGDLGGTSGTFSTDSITKGASTTKPSENTSSPLVSNCCTVLWLLVTACLCVN
ncbi:glyco_hydro_56 domain-containing protein isoform X2 [Phyllopteryx taeniolatus]|uniref:glyco_hydro_56 domain-containing protein isoform X2 n=1 Tax=Phyllopteryx taeniolatus TaxID=161469 RepID=UPI002AD3EC7C|nr:glyco_hydro_56 domain-containing protein isoform X2 [Phyllopteryx taeniolatus]